MLRLTDEQVAEDRQWFLDALGGDMQTEAIALCDTVDDLREQLRVAEEGLESLRKCPCGYEWAICSRHKEGPQSLITRLSGQLRIAEKYSQEYEEYAKAKYQRLREQLRKAREMVTLLEGEVEAASDAANIPNIINQAKAPLKAEVRRLTDALRKAKPALLAGVNELNREAVAAEWKSASGGSDYDEYIKCCRGYAATLRALAEMRESDD